MKPTANRRGSFFIAVTAQQISVAMVNTALLLCFFVVFMVTMVHCTVPPTVVVVLADDVDATLTSLTAAMPQMDKLITQVHFSFFLSC